MFTFGFENPHQAHDPQVFRLSLYFKAAWIIFSCESPHRHTMAVSQFRGCILQRTRQVLRRDLRRPCQPITRCLGKWWSTPRDIDIFFLHFFFFGHAKNPGICEARKEKVSSGVHILLALYNSQFKKLLHLRCDLDSVCLGWFSLNSTCWQEEEQPTWLITVSLFSIFFQSSPNTQHKHVLTSIPHYIPVAGRKHDGVEKKRQNWSDMSDGQQNSIMIHPRFPPAALIFFVPVTPSLSLFLSPSSENK